MGAARQVAVAGEKSSPRGDPEVQQAGERNGDQERRDWQETAN